MNLSVGMAGAALFICGAIYGVVSPQYRKETLFFLLANAGVALLLLLLGIAGNQVFGMMMLYWVFLIPCGVVAAAVLMMLKNPRPAVGWLILIVGAVMPAIIAWSMAYYPGGPVDTSCPTTYDRQGPYRDC